MSEEHLQRALRKMTAAGAGPAATGFFAIQYRRLLAGDTGILPDADLEPAAPERVDRGEIADTAAAAAIADTVVIKLNGGLGTSMGLDRAKSLVTARDGLSFLDVIARQVLAVRAAYAVRLPLLLMNSFRTRDDSLRALAAYPDLATDLPADFCQNRQPKLTVDGLAPVDWPSDPELEWCPPGHGDLYGVLHSTGLLDRLLDAGYRRAFVSNADNLGAVPDPAMAGWFAARGAPIAVEVVRRTPNDRKGGHFAVRRADGRLVLRDTAQTSAEDLAGLVDLSKHGYASTNNLWFDLAAMRTALDRRHGILGLPLIRNVKTVDPADPSSPAVIQAESAMGAAVEVFADSTTVAVTRDRFVPVKTTDDLLLLRSDCYRMDTSAVLHQVPDEMPYVALGHAYRRLRGFEERFPDGPPSLIGATSLRVEGDWRFGAGVRVVGDVVLDRSGGTVPPGEVLQGSTG